jgi:thioredoxin-related protein
MKYLLYSLFFTFSLSISAQNWGSDLSEVKATASQEDKQILLVFSGSDWCAPCMKLEKNVWQTEVFKKHSKDNLVLLKADFPSRKKNQLPQEQQDKNNALAEQYNPKGYFPFVVLLDANGKVLNQLGYKSLEPQAYINEIYNY